MNNSGISDFWAYVKFSNKERTNLKDSLAKCSGFEILTLDMDETAMICLLKVSQFFSGD